jgi:4-diphosphocytidyl-2-C-methyl-D-erythritol kinase
LGGGSSNAACVLVGLNRLWKLKLSKKELAKIASKIGADVGFFLLNRSMAVGRGAGDELKLLKKPPAPIWHVLVVPKKGLSTRLIYKSWDKAYSERQDVLRRASGEFPLTQAMRDVKILHHSIQNNSIGLLGKSLHNDLERSAEIESSNLLKIKELLLINRCVKGVLVSGSGATVFGVISSRKEAMKLRRDIARLNSKWRVFVAKTY